LVAFVYGVIEVPDKGWRSPVVAGALALVMAVLSLFVVQLRRSRYPMIDLGLVGSRRFLWGSVAATLASFALFGVLFVVPQYLQLVRGNDALGTGLRILPIMGGLLVAAPLSERVIHFVGNKIPVTVGMTIIAAGLAWG